MKATLHQWRAGPPNPTLEAAVARLCETPDVAHVVVLPDAHVADEVCVGTVTATERSLLPAAVGSDIGCGMVTQPLGIRADVLRDARDAARVLDALSRAIPALMHAAHTHPTLPPELEGPLSHPSLDNLKQREGRLEFGTLGRGNHFLELQRDADGELWIAVHSGSRCMGPAIRRCHEAGANHTAQGLRVLAADTSQGQAFLSDAQWALRYAALNRKRILTRACVVLGDLLRAAPRDEERFSTDHNHVQHERHAGVPLWVHRKGAQRLDAEALGIVPGSMGSSTFHVVGRGLPEALASAAHGAGRALARGDARRRIRVRDLDRQMQGVWFDARLRHALCEEAPAAYKNIGEVMRAQHALVRIVRRLEPVLVYKAV